MKRGPMIYRTVASVLTLVFVMVMIFFVVGKGWLGKPWQLQPVVEGPAPTMSNRAREHSTEQQPQILFGDLHTHTSYSVDASVFNSSLVWGTGVVTPADACDFARYCAALDFWSINDHAEGLTPRAWSDTLETIRACNAESGDSTHPDLVSFAGWEWSNSSKDDVANHYGHKNVIFRTWEEGQVPTRPIATGPGHLFSRVPPLLLGVMGLFEGLFDASDLAWYLQESKRVPMCDDTTPSPELPTHCTEVASTPRDLFRKLNEWGIDSLVIPHGLSWGNTNPLTGDFRYQMVEHEQRYQKLLEMYSGHGNSELFEDFARSNTDMNGKLACPDATANFTPCCRQVEKIFSGRCESPGSATCEREVEEAVQRFLNKGSPRGRKLFPGVNLADWEGCGQLRNSFQPAAAYVPRLSAQYNLALGFDHRGEPKRARLGLIGSSDTHRARPGSSYKERKRLQYTDHKDMGNKWLRLDLNKADRESGGFYYTGGLIAAHSRGRDRDAIWQALDSRNVYATSGDRILVWFDLLNSPSGSSPMGSETAMTNTPRFRVKALGSLEQIAGCPDHAVAALGHERLKSLCGGECYRPGAGHRKPVTRIEIVRIRPQIHPAEPVASLVENTWQVFDCPAQGEGCTVEFEDPDYAAGERSTLYYARVIQAPEMLIGGDPFGCEYNAEGECIAQKYCIDENAMPEMDCRAAAEPRAWTSPIFVEYPTAISR